MTDLKGGNESFYRSTTFLRELYRQGLRHIIISPGSRSTPLSLAAAALPALNKHVILDERSAAFTALGIGKATARPAMLVCTSGTAAANYYPAVIEALQSGVPLLVATADRPARLRNTDANQTINQLNLYGNFVCEFFNVEREAGPGEDQTEVKKTARQSFQKAIEYPGPVHLNFPFDKPLEPDPDFLEKIYRENIKIQDGVTDRPKSKENSFQFPAEVEKIVEKARKPLIIIGQLPANKDIKPIYRLAQDLGAPVLSEQGIVEKGVAVQGFEGFLRNEQTRSNLQPDLLLRFGLQPAAKSLLLALDNWSPNHHIYLTSSSNPRETALSVSHTLPWDGREFSLKGITPSPDGWLNKWKQEEQHFAKRKQETIREMTELTDGQVYEHLSGQIPGDWTLFFSNSFAARDRSMFGNWSTQSVYCNRGASGIDGISSTAIGVAIGSGKPGILFTGDLAFLHDTNALLNQKLLRKPLVLAVINNRGGSIFRMLPIAGYSNYFTDYFETPQHADFGKLAAGYGLPFKRIDSSKGLENFDLNKFVKKSDPCCYLHIVEFQTNPDSSMELRRRLWGE